VSLLLEVMDWTYVKAHRETPMSEAEKKVLDEVRAALAEPEKERAEVAAPARGVGTGQTNAPTGEAYRTPEPDAIARAVEAAVKECVTICERQREKILKNPADPSWTEHLAEVQSAMKQRFSVEMGYPALAEPKKERAEVAAPARSGVGAGQTNAPTGEAYPTPQPDATREPATHEQVFAAYGATVCLFWLDYRAGWRAAERFHGIRKEDT
jgi:hypothetical protein